MSGEPWGYLLPLRDGPPPLELREDTATVGTALSCTLPLDAATSGLPADAPPQVLFAVLGDASSGHAQLRSQADVVRMNDQPIPRGQQETLQHGARIAFQPDAATYVYVSSKESDSFRAPPQVLEEYLVGHRLGKGGFGNVYALFHKKQRYRRRALKIVDPKNQDVIKYVKRESRIMIDLKHPCIVETFSVEQLDQHHFILMEYMAGGDLQHFLHDRERRLTENEIKFLFFQLALAVEYLHEESICHRDLKPSNILLQKYSPNTLIKVTDFGLAKVKNYDSSLKSWAGTNQYLAPEIVRGEKSYTNSVDVWSMGIILFYCFTGSVPFENAYQGILHEHVVKYIPKNWYGVSQEAQVLVKRMLTPQVEDRLSASQVVNDPWLRDEMLHVDAARLPGLREYLASRGWSSAGEAASAPSAMSGEPWGYLLPLRDGPPPLELREDTATVGTAPSCTLPLDAATSGLPADAPPQVLFAVLGDASSGHAQLRSQADVVRVNDQPIPRGQQETLQHGARIAFQPDATTYVYVSSKESDSFRAPPQVLEEYFVGHCVDGGDFGNVYALFHKKQRYHRRALKIVELISKGVIKYVEGVSRIMMDLKHPCVVETFSVNQLDQHHFILMEYMAGGDLEHFLRDRQRRLTENEIKFLFFQLALAVEYLHKKGILHRDLKPSNILLQKYSPNTLIKVTNFGLANVKTDDSFLMCWAGTRQYLAPEIIREEKFYTYSVDIWSMGIILFYSLTGTVPFKRIYHGLVREHVVEYIPEQWDGVSEEAQTLVKRMLIPHARDRVRASEVLKDPWLRDDTMREDAARLPGLQNYLRLRYRRAET